MICNREERGSVTLSVTQGTLFPKQFYVEGKPLSLELTLHEYARVRWFSVFSNCDTNRKSSTIAEYPVRSVEDLLLLTEK